MGDTVGDVPPVAHVDLRATELARALASLVAGRGVLVVGERGSGRTQFVRDVVAVLDEATRGRLVCGEDINSLDEVKAKRFAEAVAGGRVLPLVTAVARVSLSPDVSRLVRDGAVTQVELGPLSANDLRKFAEAHLAGALDAVAAGALVPARGGSDLTALGLALSESRASGALAYDDHSWRLVRPIAPSEPLRRLLLSRLSTETVSLSTETLLELIALAPESTMASLSESAVELGLDSGFRLALEDLEETGVIEVLESSGVLRLRIRDGVTGLLLRQSLETSRRRRLTGAIVDVLVRIPAADLGWSELVALAEHAIALDRPLDAETFTRAARASLRSSDVRLSVALAQAAVAGGGGFEAEMALAMAESESGRSAEALARLQRLVGEAEGDEQLSEVITALTQQVTYRSAYLSDARALRTAAEGVAVTSQLRADVLRGFMLFTLGDPIGAAELVEPSLHHLAGEELAQAHFVIGNAAFLSGRLARASEALDAAESILAAEGLDTSRVHLLRTSMLVFLGRIPEALTIVTAFRDAAESYGHPMAKAVAGLAIGGVLIAMGRAPEAVVELQTATLLMEEHGALSTALFARADLAIALALTGAVEAATEALAPCLATQPGLGFGLEGKVRQAEGWIHIGAGRSAAASGAFRRAADAYAAPGYHLASLAALLNAARAGASVNVLARIDALADVVEGPFVVVDVRNARALAARDSLRAGDAAGMESLADEFDAIGEAAAGISLHMIAAEAFAQAATLHASSGNQRTAAASARRRDAQIAVCGLGRLPLGDGNSADRLSERESELAAMAAAGLSNRDIADRLVLSVRTVETHLQTVYRKLGVRGRSELAEVMAREVRPPSSLRR